MTNAFENKNMMWLKFNLNLFIQTASTVLVLFLILGTKAAVAHADCLAPTAIPHNFLFQRLVAVNFYIEMPRQWDAAIHCHGQEKECSERWGEVYVSKLIEKYNNIPKPLLRENIYQPLIKSIQSKVLPFVLPASDCAPPQPLLLERGTLKKYVDNPNTLTITLRIGLLETTVPHTFLFSIHYYRPENTDFVSQVLGPSIIATPVNASDADLTKALLSAIEKGVDVGVTNESMAEVDALDIDALDIDALDMNDKR